MSDQHLPFHVLAAVFRLDAAQVVILEHLSAFQPLGLFVVERISVGASDAQKCHALAATGDLRRTPLRLSEHRH
jgi:hypothetical protein